MVQVLKIIFFSSFLKHLPAFVNFFLFEIGKTCNLEHSDVEDSETNNGWYFHFYSEREICCIQRPEEVESIPYDHIQSKQ